jgi:uncharacterized membrane protein YkvI
MLDIGKWLSSSCSAVSGAFNSPLWTALIAVILIFVLSLWVLPTTGNIPVTTLVKYFVYIFGAATVCIFLHSSSITASIRETYEQKHNNTMVTNMNHYIDNTEINLDSAVAKAMGGDDGMGIPIAPRF